MPLSSSECKRLVFEQCALLDALARRRFPDQNLADEAVLFVQDALARDDWRRVAAYRGDARFASYLAQVAGRLLEDFARKKYGRLRPPAWVEERGPLFVRLFRMLCREALPAEEAMAVMDADPEGGERSHVSRAIALILDDIPDCGKSGRLVRDEETDVEALAPESPGAHQLSGEAMRERRERHAFLEALRLTLGLHEDDAYEPDPEVARRFFKSLGQRLNLSAEDRLLLTLVYSDGLGVSAAGRRLGISQDQTHGRMRRLLAKLRRDIEAAAGECGATGMLRDLIDADA